VITAVGGRRERLAYSAFEQSSPQWAKIQKCSRGVSAVSDC